MSPPDRLGGLKPAEYDRLSQSFVVVGRVHVQQEPVDGPKLGQFGLVEHRQCEDAVQVARAQPARVEFSADSSRRVRLVAREERFSAARGAHPRAVRPCCEIGKAAQHARMQERQIARDHDHAIGAGVDQGGVQTAEGARARHHVGVDRHVQIREPVRIVGHNHHAVCDSPQDVELPYDDGAAIHDEPALVESTEPARVPAGDNRRDDVGGDHGPIMTDAHLGRLLPACLHQAIAEVLPDRLEFYEEWLDPDGLRDGSIGLAPLSAVTGFLRTEGDGYEAVVARAGTLAAEWSIAALPPYQRRVGLALPAGLRCRYALRVARRIVRDVLSTSAAVTQVRRNRATMRLDASVFCGVRDAQAAPLCGFYRALMAETLRAFHIAAHVRIESCRAVSGPSCVIAIEILAHGQADRPAMAA